MDDEELVAEALAADPDAPLDDGAVPFQVAAGGLLPAWYMPTPMPGVPVLVGWRRRVALLIIAAFVLINAYGMCSTYGHVGFG